MSSCEVISCGGALLNAYKAGAWLAGRDPTKGVNVRSTKPIS